MIRRPPRSTLFPTRRSSDLATVLQEVGVKPEGRWILAEGADAAAMTRSVPIEIALDDAILAYAQNGERLDRKSTRLNSSHSSISYAVFCLKKKKKQLALGVL